MEEEAYELMELFQKEQPEVGVSTWVTMYEKENGIVLTIFISPSLDGIGLKECSFETEGLELLENKEVRAMYFSRVAYAIERGRNNINNKRSNEKDKN